MIGLSIGHGIGTALALSADLEITTTAVLELPVDVVLHGLQEKHQIINRFRTYEKMRGQASNKVVLAAQGTRRLSDASTFTTRTDSRGYD